MIAGKAIQRAESPVGRSGFTLVELLSLLVVLATLVTLATSAVAHARVRSQQITCRENLRQVVRAIEMYTSDTGKRPRSVSRVIQHTHEGRATNGFICPSDPALRRGMVTNLFWGNIANTSQEPWMRQNDLRDPESGSWVLELEEVNETEPFSYLHTLSWRRLAWQRLATMGPETGIAICQLHGVRVPTSATAPNYKDFLQYEGLVQRAQRDGAVSSRRVFRPGVTGAEPPGTDYPWEFYTDTLGAPLR